MRRYLAIVFEKEKCGYAHDYYPEEKDDCLHEFKGHILGDFTTREEANAMVIAALERLYK
jgi:hypothetical protein